ncbi:MAG: cellulose synthase operon protein YhjQ/BcsQ, partial [Candidatus Aenigmatarchaeota archaeon]
ANVGVALSQQGHDVLIIDGNFSGANMAQHFGIGFQDVSLNDVLDGNAYITQAIAKHPAGVSVLPASILEFNASADNLKHSIVEFLGDKDYVLIDSAAGTDDEVQAAVEASDEVLLVSEAELPSLTNCLGAKKLAEQLDRDVAGLVINSVRGEKSEVDEEDIVELMETEIIGKVPDHKHVREGIALREPVVSYKPKSQVSRAIHDVAYRIKGEEPPKRGLSEKMRSRLEEISPF